MNIHISYDNLVANIEPRPLPADVVDRLSCTLRYRPDGYMHVWSFKSKKWNGYNCLYDAEHQCFRRGLLDRAISALKEDGHVVTTSYTGLSPKFLDYTFDDRAFALYEFQSNIVREALTNSHGLIVSPTGSGKSVSIAKLIAGAKRKTLVIVTDIVLLDQMAEGLQKVFVNKIGMIGDGEFDLQDITVSTIQSLQSINKGKTILAAEKRKVLVNYLKQVGMVVVDEVHLADSASFGEVMPLFTGADKFIGFSATPYGWAEKAEKKDNLELEQHFGKVIYDTRKTNDFISLGLKVPIYVQVVHRDPLSSKYDTEFKKDRFRGTMSPDHTANYKLALQSEILNSPRYHEEVAKHARDLMSQGSSVFVHAQHSIEFGHTIKDLIPESVLVNGKTPRLKRREIYDAIRKKELLGLVSDIGGTGLDIPSLNAIVLASDLTDVRQLMGRVARKDKSPGATKEFGVLIDMHTKTQFLSKHYDIRRSQYIHDGHTILG